MSLVRARVEILMVPPFLPGHPPWSLRIQDEAPLTLVAMVQGWAFDPSGALADPEQQALLAEIVATLITEARLPAHQAAA